MNINPEQYAQATRSIETLFSSQQALVQILEQSKMMQRKSKDGQTLPLWQSEYTIDSLQDNIKKAIEAVNKSKASTVTVPAYGNTEITYDFSDITAVESISRQHNIPLHSAFLFYASLRAAGITSSHQLDANEEKVLIDAFKDQIQTFNRNNLRFIEIRQKRLQEQKLARRRKGRLLASYMIGELATIWYIMGEINHFVLYITAILDAVAVLVWAVDFYLSSSSFSRAEHEAHFSVNFDHLLNDPTVLLPSYEQIMQQASAPSLEENNAPKKEDMDPPPTYSESEENDRPPTYEASFQEGASNVRPASFFMPNSPPPAYVADPPAYEESNTVSPTA